MGDIDKIWGDCQKWNQEIASLSEDVSIVTEHSKESIKKVNVLRTALTAVEKKTDDLSTQISQMIKRLDSVTAFISVVKTISHLQDIDEMWESLFTAHDSIKNISGDIEKLQKAASEHQEEINKLLDFIEKVVSLKHLMDVDSIWACTEEQKLHLKEINRINEGQADRLDALTQENREIAGRISENEESIKNLNESINKFSGMAHLEDVDSIWNTVNEHSEQLIEIEKQNGDIVNSVQKDKEDVEAKIAAAIQETNSTIKSLTNKITYAYWIAGGATGLAIIELLLLLL